MRTNVDGFNLIKEFEGCRLNAYYDETGIPTIGYGHTGDDVYIGLTITPELASNLLYTDIVEFETQVAQLLTAKVNDNQFSALVSFAYNLGSGTLAHSTLLKKVNAGLFDEASNEFLKWTRAGGEVLEGLIKRREAERTLFLKVLV